MSENQQPLDEEQAVPDVQEQERKAPTQTM